MQYNPEELEEILNIFKSESEEIIQEMNDGFLQLEKNPSDKTPIKKIFQLSHSLKGAARMLGFNSIQDIAHKLEDILSFWAKDNVVISVDIFQEIYKLCDLLLELVKKSVETKNDFVDDNVVLYINKLDEFLADKNILRSSLKQVSESDYINSQHLDIDAIILELLLVLEKGQDENLEDILAIINDNISKLKDIFSKTQYENIKSTIKYISQNLDIKIFNFDFFNKNLIDLKNQIYELYKNLNLTLIQKKEDVKVTEIEKKDEEKQDVMSQISETFDYILSNLQKIKFDLNSNIEISAQIEKVLELSLDQKLKIILTKINGILKLFQNKQVVLDNECYMVILQCIYLAKRISLNEKEENLNNLNFLVQRLNILEDMFSIKDESLKLPAKEQTSNSLLNTNNYETLKKGLKSFDLEEIKVLRVDTGKIDNLIAQSGELLINGIKTREHITELNKINSKLVQWESSSKKVISYLKYLEKKGFFSVGDEEGLQAFYKKAQTFFFENSNTIADINKDFNNLYNMISEDDNKLHQTALGIETISKGMRILPLATIFHSFPRMIRDIANEKNKKIDFVVSGSDTTVDKKIIEEIKMPLIHIIRNSVSHGIELPDIREKNGKNEVGKIKLIAKQVDNNVVITIEDDGYGINLEKIKSTAIKKGMLTNEEVDNMDEEQLMKLLFIPGFSTDEEVSDISGRGIGLDVVKTKITNLNGELYIDSELNKGCKVTIKLPVSMSTIKTFVLKVNDQKYAIPVSAIKYVKQIQKEDIFEKNGRNSIIYDDHSIPILSMSSVFGEQSKSIPQSSLYTVIVIENADKQVAFVVDDVLGDQEVFHKKLIPPILKIKNISGFTTLSTGDICLIINPFELIKNTYYLDNAIVFGEHPLLLDEQNEIAKEKKLLVLNDGTDIMNAIVTDIVSVFEHVVTFHSVNSVYDFIIKNDVDVLICKLNPSSEDVVRLIKYLKTDENFNSIKLVILSELSEYEILRNDKDILYSFYQRLADYDKNSFIQNIITL